MKKRPRETRTRARIILTLCLILGATSACGPLADPFIDALHPPIAISPDRDLMQHRIRQIKNRPQPPRLSPDQATADIARLIREASDCLTNAWTPPATPADRELAREYLWAEAGLTPNNRELIIQHLLPECIGEWAIREMPARHHGVPTGPKPPTATPGDHLTRQLAACLQPEHKRKEWTTTQAAAHYLTAWPKSGRPALVATYCAG